MVQSKTADDLTYLLGFVAVRFRHPLGALRCLLTTLAYFIIATLLLILHYHFSIKQSGKVSQKILPAKVSKLLPFNQNSTRRCRFCIE